VLLTGLHTGHASVRGNDDTTLRPDDVTVGEVLKTAGYRTACIGKWGMGDEGSSGVPSRQGFDTFFGYLNHFHAHNYYPEYLWRAEGGAGSERRVPLPNVVPDAKPTGAGVARERRVYSHDLFADEALRFVDAQTPERRFFCTCASPFRTPTTRPGSRAWKVPDLGPYRDRDWPDPQKAHAAMITRMDRDIGRLMERLARRGLDRNTLVVFTSDNGPHREGGNDPEFNASHGALRGLKRDLYEGGLRVPMVARWPGRVPAGRVFDQVGYFADVLPTLAEIAGAPAAVPKNTDGISLVPTLLGGNGREQKQHDLLYWEFYERGGGRAVRSGRWKGVRPRWHAPLELYDLETDPSESRDVAARFPDVAVRLAAQMDRARTPSPRFPVPSPTATPVPARSATADAAIRISVDRGRIEGHSRFSLGVTHTQRSLDTGGDGQAIARGKELLAAACRYHNVHIMGWGTMNPNPAPGVYDWESLDRRMAMVRSIPGAVPVVTLCAAPDWMKGGKPGQTDWSKIEVAPLPEHYKDFADLAALSPGAIPTCATFRCGTSSRGCGRRRRTTGTTKTTPACTTLCMTP
jgi:arylsulfatase A-like enzyme